jgi:hypothetical protein
LAKDEYGQLGCRAVKMLALKYSSRVADQRFHEEGTANLTRLKT